MEWGGAWREEGKEREEEGRGEKEEERRGGREGGRRGGGGTGMERGREKKRGRGGGGDRYTERAQRECSVVTEVVFQAPVPFLPLAVFCLQRRRPRPWDGARTVAGSGGGGGEVGAAGGSPVPRASL